MQTVALGGEVSLQVASDDSYVERDHIFRRWADQGGENVVTEKVAIDLQFMGAFPEASFTPG